MFVSIDPATGMELARFSRHESLDVERALDRAAVAQADWRFVAIAERVKLLEAMAAVLRARKPALARLITLEMGKPAAEAEAEVEKCAINCDFYARSAPVMLADQSVTDMGRVVFEPLGTILAIMPWNYPFWQVFRFLAPALVAGNAAILKHAANVPQCALAIADVMADAGCPEGLFHALLIDPAQVETLIADDRIAAVTLTGSTQVGAIVAAQAGRSIKKLVLELGGSDPFIVLADANLDRAAEAAVKARFINAGQSCVNAKRFILVDAIADAFVERFVVACREIKIGPMARANLRDALHDQVERTIAAGGMLRLGGIPDPGPGFHYPPTVIDHVTPDMAAGREATFGPLAAIMRVPDEDAAIRLANATEFGLGASLWTRDGERAEALVRRIDAGAVFVNAIVASDPRLPFGGIRKSGYGRELGEAGLREFTNMKTVWSEMS